MIPRTQPWFGKSQCDKINKYKLPSSIVGLKMLIMKMNVSTHKMNSQQQQNGHPQNGLFEMDLCGTIYLNAIRYFSS